MNKTRIVLHIGAIGPAKSNRLALQLSYTAPEWKAIVFNIRTDVPNRPPQVEGDSLLARRAKSLLRRLVNSFAIARALFASEAAILHAHENATLWAIAYWTIVLRRPAVWDPHDYFHERLRRRSIAGKYNFMEMLERSIAFRGVPMLAVSRGMAARYHAMYPRTRVEVISSYSSRPVDMPGHRHEMETTGPTRIIYPGLIKAARLEEELIVTLGKLDNVEFDIYGVDPAGDHETQLRALLQRQSIRNVAFKGRYSSSDIGPILARYHFAIFPFPVTDSNIDFCMPNKFFQCVEAGLPLITTDMEEMGGLITRYGMGYVFKSRQYGMLVEFLTKFDVRSMEYRSMVEAVKAYRAQYVRYADQRALLLDIYAASAGLAE